MKNKIFILIGILLIVGIVSAEETSYIYANGQRIAKVNEGGVFYYHSDHLGSTSAMTDSSGKIVSSPRFSVFGSALPGTEERYGFTGKELDETGLQYFGARYYNPAAGRFMNVDPLLENHPDLTPYHYSTNNPLSFIDPDGKDFKLSFVPKKFIENGDDSFSGKEEHYYGTLEFCAYYFIAKEDYHPVIEEAINEINRVESTLKTHDKLYKIRFNNKLIQVPTREIANNLADKVPFGNIIAFNDEWIVIGQ